MNQRGNILIILSILVIFSAGTIFYYFYSKPQTPVNPYSRSSVIKTQPTSTNSAAQTQTYQSISLKFSISIPTSYTSQEGNTYTDIMRDSSVIQIIRNGTNTQSLSEYLSDPTYKKNTTISNPNQFEIGDYQAVSRLETQNTSGSKQKVVYIYIDGWVYSLSTSSESLYDDLDQIVKSFKYTP
ncbi:hypothetical protein A3F00_04005 [Candidatus Daviesbacteria bacterium RIFCSPHIGHO2_12_FULL_37_11]|uniref:PsbP C-terminal domain-containing protein n=1 Tax=Candidatus Daviesbacteria bacterium RIFCSPHIGHO2_12_FULL_37_11 TaxID=1797777 RepID=A0A1F5KC77_9BACT|nr:MAG: hypothetical protein A3F00_04005 [Candidatus Daviesbacteria bacterium RIFCSPHIGHO2_12_FULL_37_11]